jgi:hypothetical protein
MATGLRRVSRLPEMIIYADASDINVRQRYKLWESVANAVGDFVS